MVTVVVVLTVAITRYTTHRGCSFAAIVIACSAIASNEVSRVRGCLRRFKRSVGNSNGIGVRIMGYVIPAGAGGLRTGRDSDIELRTVLINRPDTLLCVISGGKCSCLRSVSRDKFFSNSPMLLPSRFCQRYSDNRVLPGRLGVKCHHVDSAALRGDGATGGVRGLYGRVLGGFDRWGGARTPFRWRLQFLSCLGIASRPVTI